MKRFLAVVSLIVCMSFTSLASEGSIWSGQEYEPEDEAMTLEEDDFLSIEEVETMQGEDQDFPYWLAQRGGDGRYYFMRFSEKGGWKQSGTNGGKAVWLHEGNHKTAVFSSKQELFQALKTQKLTINEGSGTRGFVEGQIYACNFDIESTSEEVIVEAHGWSNGETVTPEPDPDPGEDSESGVLSWVQGIYKAVKNIPETILEGVKKLFVPREDFMNQWQEEINTKFGFIEEVKTCVESFKLIAYETDEPPVITITLPEEYGGTMKVLDTNPIHKYMPTVRIYISAWLWLHFIWLLFKQLPAIISGEAMREDLDNHIDSVKSDHNGVRGAPHKSRR